MSPPFPRPFVDTYRDALPTTTITGPLYDDASDPLSQQLQRSNSARRTMQTDMNGALPMPAAPRPFGGAAVPGGAAAAERAGGQQQQQQGFGPIGMPRSPPKNKNIQHVPCKFFIYGQCQAGMTCPFSHDLESTTRPATCKYFAKGACKFGRKCALLHVAPDGTVVNRPGQYAQAASSQQQQQQPFAGNSNGAPRRSGTFSGQPPPPGLLAQGLERRHNGDMSQEDHDSYGQQMEYHQAMSPQYGSPVQDSRFGGSPPSTATKGFSVLDAPLPNSFDSNGVSMAARDGPFAASVPSRFGVESPPSSLPRKSQLGNTALRDLHSSAFGGRGMDNLVLTGSSPPSGPDEPLTFPKRPLHSEMFAQRHPQIISASLGNRLPTQSFEYSDDGEEGEEGDSERENDLLPASLHDLIPDSKSRRESRSSRGVENDDSSTPAGFLAAQRRTLSGHGTPNDSKVGSPSHHIPSSSPSRYSGMFASRRAENVEGAIGHVGSPLRNASNLIPFSSTTNNYFNTNNNNNNIASSSSPSSSAFPSTSSLPRTANTATTTTTTRGDLSPTVSSPPRQASMSMLTQELQRTKLDAARSQAAAAAVGGSSAAASGGLQRSASSGSTGGGGGGNSGGRSSFERTVSSGGGGGGGGRSSFERTVSGSAGRTSEEQVLFDMDELGEQSRAAQAASRGGGPASNGIAGFSFGAIGGHRAGK